MLLAKIVNIGNNPVAFTFFIGCMAMFASSVFFFVERGSVDKKMETIFISFCINNWYCSSSLFVYERLLHGNW